MWSNDWIYFDTITPAAEKREDEVDALAKAELSESIQTALRGRIDPGLDTRSGQQAGMIQVRSEKGQIIIDEADQAGVLSGGMNKQAAPDEQPPGIESLFEPGSGVPVSVANPDGSRELVFRAISVNQLFGPEQDRTDSVEQVVTETLQTGIVDAYERAMKTVNNRSPEES